MKYQPKAASVFALDLPQADSNLSDHSVSVSTNQQMGFIGATSRASMLPILPAVAAAAILALAPLTGWARGEKIAYDEAELFFELNNTDGDLGIHALIDGDAWSKLRLKDPNRRVMLDIRVKGRLKNQGLTEIFFESAEPRFSELNPIDFFARFPAGTYLIEGKTLEKDKLVSEVELSHTMPAPPDVTVNGESMAVQCDDEIAGFDATEVSAPVTIAWDAVTLSHPDPAGGGAGVQPPIPVTIHNYEVVVEVELGEDFTSVMHVILPPGETSLTIPEEFIALGDEFKYEVLAREESFNQTAVESCFVLE